MASARAVYVLAAVLLLIWGAVGEVLFTARRADLRNASDSVSNITTAVAQDITRNLELYDLSILGALEGYTKPIVMNASVELRQLILFDRAATAPFLGHILIVDEHGSVVADSLSTEPSTLNYADRDYFRIHQQQSDFGLYISRPLVSRSDGSSIIALSRRITKPDGSFGGVVVGTLKLDYIHQLFQQIKVGAKGSLTLFRTDGTVVMREPFDPTIVGVKQTPPFLFDLAARNREGEFRAYSVVDGIERLYHFKRLGSLPLIQNAGMAIDDVLKPWYRRALVITLVVALCSIVIVRLMFVLRRELQRRIEAEAALMQLVDRDPLTGLANRRCLDRILAAEWQRAARHTTALGLIMIDADMFKSYNDNFGHAAGDDALRQLAACMNAVARRPGDLAARFGGEEFAMVLPQTDAAGALHVAESLRKAVEALALPHPRSPAGIFTISIGVASIAARRERDVADLLVAADAALYESKSGGRNRSTLHTPVLVSLSRAS